MTQAEYQRVMGTKPSRFQEDGGKLPVEQVTWEEAGEFCRKLTSLPEERQACAVYRLPTEAEWEYACRAGGASRFGFDESRESLADYAWYLHKLGRTRRILLADSSRTLGGCTTCMETYGSGARTCTAGTTIPRRLWSIQRGRPQAGTGCTGAAVGVTMRPAAGHRAASLSCRPSATPPKVSALRGPSRPNRRRGS